MKMHFNFTKPVPAKLRQSVEMLRVVLLKRIEKGVTWRSTVAVPETSEQARIVPDPAIDTFSSLLWRSSPAAGFEMIGDAQEKVDGSTTPRTAAIESLAQVRNQPAIEVSLSELPEQDHRQACTCYQTAP